MKKTMKFALGIAAGFAAICAGKSFVCSRKDPGRLPSPSIDFPGLAKKSKAALDAINVSKDCIASANRKIPILILSPRQASENPYGVLWIHGGGYVTGMKEMALFSRAADLVERFGFTVVSPDYRLAPMHPYPAALDDCYETLRWLKENARKLGVRSDEFIVGGESAGGGLTAAVCMKARDMGEVNIAMQLPLYPMLDNMPTETNVGNHGKVWNSRRNNLAWKAYLRSSDNQKDIPPYAVPARQSSHANLPPCYTFVGTGEPFLAETKSYVEALSEAGVQAFIDEYDTNVHAFDMVQPSTELSKEAAERFSRQIALLLDLN